MRLGGRSGRSPVNVEAVVEILGGGVIVLELVAVWLLADFVSGVVHWAEDSYGTETTPVIGPWVVVPNVLHHRDPLAFVRKSWIASSWDLALVGVVVIAVAGIAGVLTWHVVLFALLGANGNQFHKWNHMRRSSVPAWVRVPAAPAPRAVIRPSRPTPPRHEG
jgi:ubiquitin-conjugating enzyme E2 variant